MARARVKRDAPGKPKRELDTVFGEIRKRYGDKSVSRASEVYQTSRISTGSFMLDFCTLGGIPISRGSMFIGDKHAGKTTMACKVIANTQRQYPDQTAVIIDVEGTFDTTWASQLGVDVDQLYIAHADTGEMAVDMADAIVSSRETSLVVVDSLAQLLPTKEAESSAEDAHIGLQARLIGGMVRKLTSAIVRERMRDHLVTTLFLNQFRTKIGGWSPTGDPRTMPGGRSMEHFMALLVHLKNKENKGKDAAGIDTITENEHPFTITKNKGNAGPRSGAFILARADSNAWGLEVGEIENATTILSYAKKFGLYTGGGKSWKIEFPGHSYKVANADQAVAMLMGDREVMMALWVYLIQLQAANVRMDADFIARIPSFYE